MAFFLSPQVLDEWRVNARPSRAQITSIADDNVVPPSGLTPLVDVHRVSSGNPLQSVVFWSRCTLACF